MVYVMKTKALISCTDTAQQICALRLHNEKSRLSHAADLLFFLSQGAQTVLTEKCVW